MNKIVFLLKTGVPLVLLGILGNIQVSQATEEETGLCPNGFREGLVTTAYVDCYDDIGGTFSDQIDAEQQRIELEARCNAVPNSEITNSQIEVTNSGHFTVEVNCRVLRPLAPGTKVCPNESTEVFRAFDTLICQYFGNAVESAQEGQAVIASQTSQCTNEVGGQVLLSSVEEGMVDDIMFYFTSLACAVEIPATNVIECPFGYHETDRDDDMIECEISDSSFESEAEANEANLVQQTLCTDTTAGLGTVTESVVTPTSAPFFVSTVVCVVTIPRFSDYADQTVLRACDETCTEQIEQARTCLNGGQLGGPGCVGPATQVIERKCNTGPDRSGLCPLVVAPATAVTPMLLDEDEEP